MSSPADPAFERMAALHMVLAVAAMAAVVVGSNYLVQFPINDWLTWGAFTYPAAFLVSDLLNRRFGPHAARRVAWVGFGIAVCMSLWAATPRIALASGTAFIVAQLLDIRVFDRLRHGRWWRAPLFAVIPAAVLDTALFFSIAFAGMGLPWVSWALGDLGVKLLVGVFMLAPFRMFMWNLARPYQARS